MPFTRQRTIYFQDTDAAGVVYFANYLSICHEAYEEALAAAGINLRRFFADTGTMIPVTRSEADYLRPLVCGDRVAVTVQPRALGPNSYEICFELERLGPPLKRAARVRTEHICIDSQTRQRRDLPAELAAWVSAG